MTRRLLALILAVALVAFACADSDDADETPAPAATGSEAADSDDADTAPEGTDPEAADRDDEEEAPVPSDTEADTATEDAATQQDEASDDQAADADDAPGDDDAVAEEPEPAPEPVVLTASYRGVTEDTITIGVAHIDWEMITEQFGLERDFVPASAMYSSWVAALNEAGGIDGRTVELILKPFLPVGTGPSEQLCLELMEDEEVFLAIGQLLDNNPLCFTEEYAHPYVGHFGETPEIRDRSNGLFFAVQMAEIPQRVEAARLLAEDGEFDGRRVALVWQDPLDATFAEAVRPVLEAGGAEIVAEIETGLMIGNAQVDLPRWTTAFERAAAEGADLIVSVGDYAIAVAVDLVGTDLPVILISEALSHGEVLFQVPVSDDARSHVRGAGMWRATLEGLLEDPAVQQCIDEIHQFSDVTVDVSVHGEVDDAITHCQVFRLAVAILDASGPELTPESVIAGGEGIGNISLPGQPDGFLGQDRHSAGRTVARYVYDAGAGIYVQVGEARVVG